MCQRFLQKYFDTKDICQNKYRQLEQTKLWRKI